MTVLTKNICIDCLQEKIDLCAQKIEHFLAINAVGDEAWEMKIWEKAKVQMENALYEIKREVVTNG